MATLPPDKRTHRARALFIRGLAVLLPTILTLALIVMVVRFIEDYVSDPINRAAYWLLSSNDAGRAYLRWRGVDVRREHDLLDGDALPPDLKAKYAQGGSEPDPADPRVRRFTEDFFQALEARRPTGFFASLESLFVDRGTVYAACADRAFPPILGFFLSLALVFGIGYLAGGFLGRKVLRHFENALFNIPVIRGIYPHAKQVVEFFFDEKKKRPFRAVVAIPYPHRDVYALAFLVGEGVPGLSEKIGRRYVTVFVPSSPTPFTGYTLFARSEDIIPLDISVEDALKIVVSGGVLRANAGDTSVKVAVAALPPPPGPPREDPLRRDVAHSS